MSQAPDDPSPQDTAERGAAPSAPRRLVRRAVGPRLRKVLFLVLGLFALLSVNAVYLLGVRLLEWTTGRTYQNWFYIVMFLVHLVLGALIVVPVVAFGFAHMRNTYSRRNRRAVRVGYALFTVALLLLASGIVLTRIEGFLVVKDPAVRSAAYWMHVLTPLVAGWLFVIHRLAGPRIRWQIGRRWAVVAVIVGAVMLALQAQDPRRWNEVGPKSGERYFFPSLARTATGNFIPAKVLQNDSYCVRCHPDIHADWSHSVHRFSSFNNPPYLFSVRETREVAAKTGDNGARFCAGCHDPVVFFSGKFDDPKFDDVHDPTSQAGITCTVCHSITHINSVRGNSDYTIDEPMHYPFAFSQSPWLRFVNEQLVKAKPELHKKTFLKQFHHSAEFCGTCHKVHLPPELNHYKWLRGQNHYDSYLLSGVSGHGVTSFYYPPKAEPNCSGCHMKLMASNDFGARRFDDSGELTVHRHLFPSANTGIPYLLKLPQSVIDDQMEFNKGITRVDLFGIKPGGTIEGELIAPLRPQVPELEPGRSYLLEAVIRTVKIGHELTQGTGDSNELWLDVEVSSGGRVIGRSGGLGPDGEVDPWSHFVNVYMLDREGNRIDRRNAQDIFTPLYNHQIPPGAGEVVHYRLDLPRRIDAPITVRVALRYRKFDTIYLKKVYGDSFQNTLPIMTMAEDSLTFPVRGVTADVTNEASVIEEWQRWNDYGIGLLRKGGKSKGELRGAEEAFERVEALGRPDGPLNLARVYITQGTVQDQAIAALERAAKFDPPAPAWSVAWFTGLVNKQNGFLDEAIANFRSIVDASTPELRERGFDFSKDYRLLNELGQTLFERAKLERGEQRTSERGRLLSQAAQQFERALELDPENFSAHFNLDLIYRQLGRDEDAAKHRALYLKYKPDDNAQDRAINIARSRDPAANHAAEAIVIYDLRRPGAFGLSTADAAPGERAAAL